MRLIDAHELERKVEPDEYYHSNEAKAMIEDTPTIDLSPNPPLTLEEVRELSEGEKVWIELLQPPLFKEKTSGYYQKGSGGDDTVSLWSNERYRDFTRL